jgi:hypothetical protein
MRRWRRLRLCGPMPSNLSLKLCLRCSQRDLGCTFPREGGGVVGSALIDCTSESSVRSADESVDDEERALAVAAAVIESRPFAVRASSSAARVR